MGAKIEEIRLRINLGEKKIGDRQRFIDCTSDEDLSTRLCVGRDDGLRRLEGLYDKFQKLTGRPYFCPAVECKECPLQAKGQCWSW